MVGVGFLLFGISHFFLHIHSFGGECIFVGQIDISKNWRGDERSAAFRNFPLTLPQFQSFAHRSNFESVFVHNQDLF